MNIYNIKRETEGPFTFKILSVEFNKGSSLQRESVFFNDSSCPIQLSTNAMTFSYENNRFQLSSAMQISIDQPLMAFEVRYILFDVFGRHMKNLSNLEVRDIAAGPLTLHAKWNLFDDNTPYSLLTTVIYIARVRLPDGTQWVYNSDNLMLTLGSLHLERKIEDVKEPQESK